MVNKAKIEELILPIIEGNKAFLIDVAVRREHGKLYLEIFIDNDTGVTTDLCASLSHEISRVIEDSNLLERQYYLIVSSPGTDRPLKFKRQYPKNIGRFVKVKVKNEQQVESLEGELLQVTDDEISVRTGEDIVQNIPFEKILRTTVEPKL